MLASVPGPGSVFWALGSGLSLIGDMVTPDPSTDEGFIELPAPTPWPMVVALGITLLFAGLVTHALVTIVGIILLLRGGVGWWFEVLPQQHVEHLPLVPLAQRAKPVQTAPHRVEQLVAGVGGHRVRIPAEMHPYSAGIKGGLVGAVAMAVLAEAYGLLAFGSLWYPINLMAAVVMPSLATAGIETLKAFNPLALAVATVTHLIVSLFVGLVYAAILPMFPRHPAIWGGWIAPLLWSALLWTSLSIINPVLNARIDWLWFVASQIAFGLTAGFVVARTQKISTMQTWPLAMRAGVEAGGSEEAGQ